ncbi:MAG: 30S ribosomal protein S6 [Mariprofundaceae bacterium]|nr:30S ribosomal protein S6 [Mariprofundaceae bacterium]
MYYETVFVINPDVSQENAQQLTDQFVERVEQAAGRIVRREYWGNRQLAYSIQKRKRGHYILLITDGSAKSVAALEQAIRLEERIMRFLTVQLNELPTAASPLMRTETKAAEEVESSESDKAEEKTEEAKDGESDKVEEKTEEAVVVTEAEEAVVAPEAKEAVVVTESKEG